MIAVGYAQDKLPSGRDLASQPTISRLVNFPDIRSLLRMGQALVDLYCASFRRVPEQIVLDVDDIFHAVHGGQQLRLFNGHHDEYGFQPIVVFDGDGRIVTAVLRHPNGPRARRSELSSTACCVPSGPTGRPPGS